MLIVSISLLRKILNACQTQIYGIVAHTFLNICEKNSPVSVKYYRRGTQKKIGSFFLSHGVDSMKKATKLSGVLGGVYAGIRRIPTFGFFDSVYSPQ